MMLEKISARHLFWLLVVLVSTAGVPAAAQIRIAPQALVQVSELDELMRVGEQLEQQQRWGEALQHYEDAVRRHPEQVELHQRLTLARLHYDVARRYADTSFVATLSQLRDHDALDLYGEVLLKIHAHYVDSPDWQKLAMQGATALEVALREAAFLQRHQLAVRPEQYAHFTTELRRKLQQLPYRSRHDAREAAWQAALVAQRHLQLPPTAALLEYSCAAVGTLDSYSAFLTRSQLDDVLSQIEGSFVGLGIELKAEDNTLHIVHVIPGGPAEQAGLRAGERIVQVDGKETAEVTTDVAADMLKGVEGSSVDLNVVDEQMRSRHVRVTRTRVEVPSVEQVKIVDSDLGIGYLRLASFQKTTSRDVEAALWDLHRNGMQSLIVDVRGNPGGLLTAAVEVADKFISQGSIVSTRGRSSGEDYDYKAHLIGTWRVPLIVLIDEDSASASEIFAGAIRDHRRGTLVGHRSYGKGSVQGIFPLNIGNVGMRLTTAKFYSPSGTPISQRGVQPDVVVRTTARITSDGSELLEPQGDAVLNAGLQVARDQLSRR